MSTPSASQLRQDEPVPESEDAEAWQVAQEAAKLLTTVAKEITPARVAMAGAAIFLLLTVAISGWYWVLPRDSVMVETHYMQRGGHLMMTEIHNDGSRPITDVVLEIRFETTSGEELGRMSLELKEMNPHTSISGDELEMMVIGHTVWDAYIVVVEVEYEDYSGQWRQSTWRHEVGLWSQEVFKDRAERHIWPMD